MNVSRCFFDEFRYENDAGLGWKTDADEFSVTGSVGSRCADRRDVTLWSHTGKLGRCPEY